MDAAVKHAGGLDAFRRHALSRLKVKTVVRESHCCQIQALAANAADATCRNLFATAGRGQATVYDGAHLGDGLGVVVQYGAPPHDGKALELLSCAWLPPGAGSDGAAGDAWLAVGAADKSVHVISVAEAAVIRKLEGHESDPVELSAAPGAPRLLLALCRDGGVALWDVAQGEALAAAPRSDAFSAVLGPCGSFYLTGTRSGHIHRWHPAADGAAPQGGLAPPGPGEPQQQQQEQPGASKGERLLSAWRGAGLEREPLELPGLGGSALEALRFLPGGRLLTRAVDGGMRVFDWATRALLAQWRVPGCGGQGASHNSKCGVGHTADGAVVVAGNPHGWVFAFDAASGARLAGLAPYRAPAYPVRGCGVSEDCRHVVAATGAGYLFRYEHRPERPQQQPGGQGEQQQQQQQQAQQQQQERQKRQQQVEEQQAQEQQQQEQQERKQQVEKQQQAQEQQQLGPQKRKRETE